MKKDMSKAENNQEEMKNHVESIEVNNDAQAPKEKALNECDEDDWGGAIASIKEDLDKTLEVIRRRKAEIEAGK